MGKGDYRDEFKRDAVRQVTERGYVANTAAENLCGYMIALVLRGLNLQEDYHIAPSSPTPCAKDRAKMCQRSRRATANEINQ